MCRKIITSELKDGSIHNTSKDDLVCRLVMISRAKSIGQYVLTTVIWIIFGLFNDAFKLKNHTASNDGRICE
jgi:hypothetical protein